MGGHTAADGQDALRRLHTGDILRGGLQTNQHDLLAGSLPCLSRLGGEHDLTASRAGGSTQTASDGRSRLQRLGVELRVQERIQVTGINHQDSLFLGAHTLVHQVAGDLQRRLGGTLAVTGLQHIQLAVLDGELHILHIAVVVLQDLAHLGELCERLGEQLRHLLDLERRADAGDDVLALCVGQELTHQVLLAGCGVTGEGDTGAAVVTHVAERHHLHVDGGAPAVRNIVVAAVHIGAGVIPRAEDSLDGAQQLLLGIVREVGADLLLVLSLELVSQRPEVLGGQLDVEVNALLLLHLVDQLLEVLLADLHDNIGIHLDEPTVAVPCPAGVARHGGNGVDDRLIQTEVQDGIHHTGHGRTRAGADRHEQGVLLIAELLAGDLLHLLDVGHDLRHDLVIDLSAVLVVLCARLGADGKALGNRKTDVGHLGEVCALAAQQFAHVGVAFGKEVAILLSHWIVSSVFI